ncbi:hypothetical protein [Streptomyces sp. CMC78]|uniref:Transcriptional regulator n=1 Tax=Streptomyces sp. CMC78 TaxID=3231512 RepID=A0AB33KD55_9ACTN
MTGRRITHRTADGVRIPRTWRHAFTHPEAARRSAAAPAGPGRAGLSVGELATELDAECASLVDNLLLPAELVTRNRRGDALYDLATFTLGHEEHLDDVLTGYGTDVYVLRARM